jgi:hypothetical protein
LERRGEFITETLEYDGGRQVTAYVPAKQPEAIVFLPVTVNESLNGVVCLKAPRHRQRWSSAYTDRRMRPCVCTNILPSSIQLGSSHMRSSSWMVFVVGLNRGWASRCPRNGRLYWASPPGELALALGPRHPEVYGAIFCASPGAGYEPPAVMPNPPPRVYLVAGTQEPFFLMNATLWAEALRSAGADITMEQRVGTHGGMFCRDEFPRMLSWAFGKGATTSVTPT